MRYVPFYEEPLGSGVVGIVRRAARKLLFPFFRRLEQDVCSLRDSQGHDDHFRYVANLDLKNFKGQSDALNLKLDQLNTKLDQLNSKFDELNVKMESTQGKVRQLAAEGETLRDEFAAVVALQWDHVAVTRRLAQLEDRMIGAEMTSGADDTVVLFPGLDRFNRTQAG